ncbi:MAG: FIG01043527: hypothetical protein, partial [uncultured Friedmanniella sp.]
GCTRRRDPGRGGDGPPPRRGERPADVPPVRWLLRRVVADVLPPGGLHHRRRRPVPRRPGRRDPRAGAGVDVEGAVRLLAAHPPDHRPGPRSRGGLLARGADRLPLPHPVAVAERGGDDRPGRPGRFRRGSAAAPPARTL